MESSLLLGQQGMLNIRMTFCLGSQNVNKTCATLDHFTKVNKGSKTLNIGRIDAQLFHLNDITG